MSVPEKGMFCGLYLVLLDIFIDILYCDITVRISLNLLLWQDELYLIIIILLILIMSDFESDKHLQTQIITNIENIQKYYGLASVDSLKTLVDIILDRKRAELLFLQRNVTVSSIFQKKNLNQDINPEHINIYANKYTFEKLVDKFPKPKGQTNRMLIKILQRKMSKQVIVSHQTRKNIWLLISGSKFNMNRHKGLYQKLIQCNNYPDYFNRAIKQDITRTVNKSQTSQHELQSLTNVLLAFSRRNPYVGYCQGLNFVAYFILTMQFTEEEAFWLLSEIIQTVIPMDYYTNMIGVVCDQQVFLAVLAKIHPLIVSKFNNVGLDPSILSIQWFVCLFTSSLPFYLVKIVWDRLLVEGPRAFIKTGIIIMGHFQKEILKVSEFHEIILLLEKGTKQLEMTEMDFNSKYEQIYISREGLILARTLYREYYLKEKLNQNLSLKKFHHEDLICDVKWPICTHALEKNRRTRQQLQVWTFLEGKPPKLDHNYLLKQQLKPQKVKKTFGIKNKAQKIKMKQQNVVKRKQQTKSSIYMQQIGSLIIKDIILQSELKARNEQFQVTKQLKLDSLAPDFSHNGLMIGRIAHICNKPQNDKHRDERERSNRKSMIIEQGQNEQLKKSNIKKMMSGIIEQEVQRSQTIQFFSKFVNDNTQLSNIIVPSSKIV